MPVPAVSTNKPVTFADAAADLRTTGSKNLGVQDFLKLITVQLTSQDPLKPMEDTQFISQMASFTSLEQMQLLSKDFSEFTSQQELARAQDFLGKTVMIETENGDVSGPVTKVSFEDGLATLFVGGKEYSAADVISVTDTPPPTPTQPST